jgi:hypothetical protein
VTQVGAILALRGGSQDAISENALRVSLAIPGRGELLGLPEADVVAPRIRPAVVPNTSAGALGAFVRGAIKDRNATVFTDAWVGYASLRRQGVDHRPRVGGRGRSAAKFLPSAHSAFGNLKTWLRGTFHGVSTKHLRRYLDEFVYRFDRRWREEQLFASVLRRATQAGPCPYYRLTAEPVA